MIVNYLSLILFLLSFCCWSQQQKKLLTGVINNGIDNLPGTHIINKNDNKATYTIDNGSFEILTSVNDTLKITHVGYKSKEIIVNENHFRIKKNIFQLERETIELDEISLKRNYLSGSLTSDLKKINYETTIDAKTLGLPYAHSKKITQTERKLNTASKNYSKIKLKGGDLSIKYGVDPIINSISGRTKKIKKELEVEQLQKKIDYIKTHHSNLIKQLGIDILNIDRFIYFISLDKNFNEMYSSENFVNFLIEQAKLYKQP